MAVKQYVVFNLNNQNFGVEITRVDEITENKKAIELPDTLDYVEGVVNLRGKIVPIIDMKKRLNINGDGDLPGERIIVIGLDEKKIGLRVDDASEVIQISEENIEEASSVISNMNVDYIEGIAKDGERIIMILDFERLLAN